MGGEKVRIFADNHQLSEQLGLFVAAVMAQAVAERGVCHVAFSGGSTPSLYLPLIAKQAVEWEHVHGWWVDERHVPPESAQSNVALVTQAMGVPMHWHMPQMGQELQAAAEAYQRQLQAVPQEKGMPCFDLLFLGAGADGHVASLFPDDAEWKNGESWVRGVKRVPGPDRITLSLPILHNSRTVVMVMTGAEKRVIAARCRGVEKAVLPVDEVLPEAGRVYWFLDAAASDTGSC